MSTTVPPPTSSVPIAINKNAPQPSTFIHHNNPDQRMANEAQHQANLMSEASPLPRELLSEVESQKGKVPLAGGEHVDIEKVEAQHTPQVGHVMKEPNMFEKMGDTIKNVTSSQSSSSSSTPNTSTSASGSIHTRDNIPHSALPNDTLHEIQSAKGSVPHAHHVDINKVEQQHQPAGLGHVQKEPNVLDKMGAALKNLTGSHSSSSGSSTSTSTSGSDILPPHDNIPHSALPDDALREIHKAGGEVPHAHHVDISKVEEKVQPQGLGHVEKDKNILQRATEFLTQSVPPQRPDIPHSSLSTEVLREVTAAKGSVPHAHHIDVEQVEKAHQVEPLGHVVEKSKDRSNNNNNNNNKDEKPGLMQKIKDAFTSQSSSNDTSSSSTGKDSAQHAAVSDAVLNDIKKADVHNLHHVNVADVEQRSALTNDMGHVVSKPEPVSYTTTTTCTTTTTTTEPVARFIPGSNVNPAL